MIVSTNPHQSKEEYPILTEREEQEHGHEGDEEERDHQVDEDTPYMTKDDPEDSDEE